MADIRIKDLAVTAGSSASDDYLAVDGSTNGTRKLSAYSPTFGGNLTVSGTGLFGGATGPHTFGNGAGAVEVRAVGDSSGYYGYSFYTGGAYESSLKHTSGSGILKLDVGRNSAWGGSFEIYADTTRAARFAKTSTTLDGNLSVNGTGLSAISGNLNVAGVGTFNKSLDSITTETDYAIRIKTSADDGGLFLGANSTISAIQAIDPGTTFSRNLAIQSQGGNVLIGTTTDGGQKLQVSGDGKFSGSVYAEKSGAGIAGQSVGAITQFTTVNSTTYNVSVGSAKVFVVQLASGDAALCYTSYKSSTITILGSDGTIVNSNAPSSTKLGIFKSANDHAISFVTGSNALAGGYAAWGFCFLGNPVISIA